jgi:hypothetical protein
MSHSPGLDAQEIVMKKLRTLVATSICLLTGAHVLDGNQPLTLQVSPLMAPAPAFVSVRATVEANDDNRALEVIAQSPDFYRSSRVELPGRNAPRLAVFEYASLPPGLYDITGVLVGTSGRRAAVSRLVRVVGMAGSGK